MKPNKVPLKNPTEEFVSIINRYKSHIKHQKLDLSKTHIEKLLFECNKEFVYKQSDDEIMFSEYIRTNDSAKHNNIEKNTIEKKLTKEFMNRYFDPESAFVENRKRVIEKNNALNLIKVQINEVYIEDKKKTHSNKFYKYRK